MQPIPNVTRAKYISFQPLYLVRGRLWHSFIAIKATWNLLPFLVGTSKYCKIKKFLELFALLTAINNKKVACKVTIIDVIQKYHEEFNV